MQTKETNNVTWTKALHIMQVLNNGHYRVFSFISLKLHIRQLKASENALYIKNQYPSVSLLVQET